MNWKYVKGSGRGQILRYYASICLEGLRRGSKTLSQDCRSQGRDFNPGFPEYEAGMLTIRFDHDLR
jgi:hypothetical protein